MCGTCPFTTTTIPTVDADIDLLNQILHLVNGGTDTVAIAESLPPVLVQDPSTSFLSSEKGGDATNIHIPMPLEQVILIASGALIVIILLAVVVPVAYVKNRYGGQTYKAGAIEGLEETDVNPNGEDDASWARSEDSVESEFAEHRSPDAGGNKVNNHLGDTFRWDPSYTQGSRFQLGNVHDDSTSRSETPSWWDRKNANPPQAQVAALRRAIQLTVVDGSQPDLDLDIDLDDESEVDGMYANVHGLESSNVHDNNEETATMQPLPIFNKPVSMIKGRQGSITSNPTTTNHAKTVRGKGGEGKRMRKRSGLIGDSAGAARDLQLPGADFQAEC
jgi:hypothetical protein